MPRTGTGRVFQRNEIWWVDYSFRGKRFRESTGSTKKGDAVKLLRTRMAEMAGGKVTGPDEQRVMFDDLMELVVTDYKKERRKSLRRLESAIGHLRGYFGDLPALAITTERVNAYTLARRDAGASDSTIQKELAALKRAFRLAVAGRILTGAPAIKISEPKNARKGFFKRADVEALAKELPEHLRPILWFGFYTGWRKARFCRSSGRRSIFKLGRSGWIREPRRTTKGAPSPSACCPTWRRSWRRSETPPVPRRRRRGPSSLGSSTVTGARSRAWTEHGGPRVSGQGSRGGSSTISGALP